MKVNGHPPEQHLILYDGVCHLCHSAVQFILPRDPEGRFRFVTLQSERGKALLTQYGMPAPTVPESIVYIAGDRAYRSSGAALRIAGKLGFPWNLAILFLAIPSPIRDLAYQFIARNRYRWFGKEEACLLPRPEWRERFLD